MNAEINVIGYGDWVIWDKNCCPFIILPVNPCNIITVRRCWWMALLIYNASAQLQTLIRRERR